MKRALVWMITGMMLLTAGCGQTMSTEEAASEEPKVIDMETEEETAEEPEKELPKRTKAGERLEEIQKSGVLLIGISPDYAPFAFETTDEEGNTVCAGADVELGKYLAEELGVQAEFVKMEFDDCLKAAKEGTVDLVLLGMLPEKDRTAYVDFTDSYYEPGEQVLLVRKTQAEKFKTLDDFAGKTVEAQYGSLQAQLVMEQLPESYMELSDTAEDGVFQVRIGKADAVALDGNLAEDVLAENEELDLAKAAFTYESEGVVAGVVKGESGLLEKINELIEKAVGEKRYLQWLDAATAQARS